MSQAISGSETGLWVERRGSGPDVLLIAGLGDPAEVWTAQLDGLAGGHRLTAFDNRGVGRTPLPAEPLSVPAMADDTAALLRELDVASAHVAGFSGGSAIAQELAIRHPELVRSLVLQSTFARADAYFAAMLSSWRRIVLEATDERALLEAFYLWIYTPRAHADGTVERLIDEVLGFAHPQSADAFVAQLDAFAAHDALERLPAIAAPTLVLAGEVDIAAPPRYGAIVAERIPGARLEVLAGEAHQPFQERPKAWNARVDAFWREVEARR